MVLTEEPAQRERERAERSSVVTGLGKALAETVSANAHPVVLNTCHIWRVAILWLCTSGARSAMRSVRLSRKLRKNVIKISLSRLSPRTQTPPRPYRAQETTWWFCTRHRPLSAFCTSWMMGRGYHNLSVGLPDKKTVLDAELIYFNDHYDIALLHINLEVTLEVPSFGRGPEYGQEVFVLARDGGASLRARRGNIEWLEESDILGRDHYMFLSCDIPEGGNGGMVIDNDGVVRGMAIYCSPYPAVTSISTIVKCIDMFMQFNRVARPLLGIGVRTIALLDVQLQEDIRDFGIKGGFLVDRVYNPVAEDLGIKRGHVIISINGQGALTLPELEDYLLTLGWNYLEDKSNCMKDVKLRVCDLKSGVEIGVTLPVRFYDKSERKLHYRHDED